MTKDQTFKFVQAWRALDKRQKDLDYERSKLCADIRAQCADDKEFLKWCEFNLGLTEHQRNEMLVRARSIAIIKDPETYKRVAGEKPIRQLERLIPLPRKEQVAIIEQAKAENLQIQTILRRRETPQVEQRIDYHADAIRLAQFIEFAIKDVPDTIRPIVERYLTKKKAAA